MLSELARLWSNWRYRNIPSRISDRVDNQDFMNLKTFRALAKQIYELDKRVKHLEMLEKHRS